MARFLSAPAAGAACEIAYADEGQGPPVLLVHGFASNVATNWRGPGWFEALLRAGRRVIALDVRGHGASARPHDPAAYDEGLLAGDCAALLDHLGLGSADVFGYSMGAFIAIRLMLDTPRRVRRAVLGGIGANYFGPVAAAPAAIAAAMEAASAADVADPVARAYRLFAEQQRNDLAAMAACYRRPRRSAAPGELAAVAVPVLVVVGERDMVTGPGEALARAFPHGTLVTVPGRDHMSAVGDKATKAAVLDFLAG